MNVVNTAHCECPAKENKVDAIFDTEGGIWKHLMILRFYETIWSTSVIKVSGCMCKCVGICLKEGWFWIHSDNFSKESTGV